MHSMKILQKVLAVHNKGRCRTLFIDILRINFQWGALINLKKKYICITDCYMLPKYNLKLYSAHKNIKAKNWNSLKDILILCPATDFYKQVGIHISYKIILKTQETGVFVTWAPYTQKKSLSSTEQNCRTFFCNILEHILQILKNVFTSNTFTIIHQPCDTELPVIQNVSRLRWKISMMIYYD